MLILPPKLCFNNSSLQPEAIEFAEYGAFLLETARVTYDLSSQSHQA